MRKPEVEVDLPASRGERARLVEVVLHRLEPGERGRDVGFQLDVLPRVLEQASAPARRGGSGRRPEEQGGGEHVRVSRMGVLVSGLGVDRVLDLLDRTRVRALPKGGDGDGPSRTRDSGALVKLLEDGDRGVRHLEELVARDPSRTVVALSAIEPGVPLEVALPSRRSRVDDIAQQRVRLVDLAESPLGPGEISAQLQVTPGAALAGARAPGRAGFVRQACRTA